MVHPQTGTPQGGVVSPVLANIYLHYVLDLWFERVVRPKQRGRCRMIRYAALNRLLERFHVPRPRIVEKNGQRMPCQRELSFCQRLLNFRRPGAGLQAHARAS